MEIEEVRRSTADKRYSDSLYEVVFQPVMERPEYQTEPIYSKLTALQEAMGKEAFDTYINSLLRITYNGTALWLITKKEINRTILEGRYLGMIREVFAVQSVRIFTQA